MAATNYTLRLNKENMEKAEQVFNTLGMSFSTGINIYIKAVIREQKIPFDFSVDEDADSAIDQDKDPL